MDSRLRRNDGGQNDLPIFRNKWIGLFIRGSRFLRRHSEAVVLAAAVSVVLVPAGTQLPSYQRDTIQ